MGFHRDMAVENIHVPHNWAYADRAAREAATGFVAADVGKLARQEDDDSIWLLTAPLPVVWARVDAGTYRRTVHNVYDFMPADEAGWVFTTTNGTIAQAQVDGHFGMREMTVTGLLVGNKVWLAREDVGDDGVKLGQGDYDLEIIVRTGANLPSAADDYEVLVGLMDVSATLAAVGHGCYFRIRWTGAAVKLNAVTEKTTGGAGTTETDTGVALAAGTKYILRIAVNAVADEVKFYVDDTLVATHGTNIEGTLYADLECLFERVGGGTAGRNFFVDCFEEVYNLAATR